MRVKPDAIGDDAARRELHATPLDTARNPARPVNWFYQFGRGFVKYTIPFLFIASSQFAQCIAFVNR